MKRPHLSTSPLKLGAGTRKASFLVGVVLMLLVLQASMLSCLLHFKDLRFFLEHQGHKSRFLSAKGKADTSHRRNEALKFRLVVSEGKVAVGSAIGRIGAMQDISEAAYICTKMPKCYLFALDPKTGDALFSSDRDWSVIEPSQARRTFVGMYDWQRDQTSTARGCPDGLTQVAKRQDKCDICVRGLCSVHNMTIRVSSTEQFGERYVVSQLNWDSDQFKALNPAIVDLPDTNLLEVLFRVSNLTMCKSKFLPRLSEEAPALSSLTLCRTSNAFDHIRCAHIGVNCNSFKFCDPMHGAVAGPLGKVYHFDPIFVGPEDPRIVNFLNETYVTFVMNVKIKRVGGEILAHQRARMVLAKLNRDTDLLEEAVFLDNPRLLDDADAKNWAPFQCHEHLCVVTRGYPVELAHVDLGTGWCEPMSTAQWSSALLPKASMGPAPVSLTSGNFLFLVHFHRSYHFGRIYHHFFIELSIAPEGTSKIERVSKPFRLPKQSRNGDVQFASGMVINNGSLVLAYGEQDCGFTVVSQPFLSAPSLVDEIGHWNSDLEPQIESGRNSERQWATVRLLGPIRTTESFAQVNRELMLRLRKQENVTYGITILDTSHYVFYANFSHSDFAFLEDAVIKTNDANNADFEVLFHSKWPLDWQYLSNLDESVTVLLLFPWEFSHVPIPTVQTILASVTYTLAPSTFVREALARSGVAQDRIEWSPHGIDHSESTLQGVPCEESSLPGLAAGFVFLYHGGAMWRKGIDILISAYLRAFSWDDNVTLLLHLTYGDKEVFDHCQIHAALAGERSSLLDENLNDYVLPSIVLLQRDTPGDKLQNTTCLYRLASAFVQPYRGEGFGMTMLEAMAHGLPVIAPESGAARDFLTPENAFLVSSAMAPCEDPPCAEQSIFGEPTIAQPQWNVINASSLSKRLKQCFGDWKRRRRVSRLAKQEASKWTWHYPAQQLHKLFTRHL